MNRIFLTAVISMAFACFALMAQNTSNANSQTPTAAPPQSSPHTTQPQAQAPAAEQYSANPRIAPGSVIPVQLTKTIDAKKAKTGEEVVAKVTQDMKTQSGEVLVPKDTKVIGHVTEAQARNKQQKESELAINFDQAVIGGNSMPLPMSIQAVIGQQNNGLNSGTAPAGTSPSASPNAGSGMPAGGGSGRTGMGGTPPPQEPSTGGMASPSEQNNAPAHPVINGQTQGVIGISNLTLAPAQNGNQGSLMTSEKNNVKLESGTILLLKVKPQ